MVLVALLGIAYLVSYGILSRWDSEKIPEHLLPGGYTVYRFPGTTDMRGKPNEIPVNRLQHLDELLRGFYLPLIKMDQGLFKNVHHRGLYIETARGEGGECLGYPARYVVD